MEQEIWKDIIGYEGYYQVSNIGNVKSIERTFIGKGGCIGVVKERIMKSEIDVDGYIRFKLCKSQKYKNIKRSVLIARHFIQNPNNLPVVRHLNDIKTDDRIENLAWGTRKDNSQDAIRNGTFQMGEKHWKYGKSIKIGDSTKELLKSKKSIVSNISGRIVLNVNTGIFYESATEAASTIGVNGISLARKLRGDRRNNTSFIYV